MMMINSNIKSCKIIFITLSIFLFIFGLVNSQKPFYCQANLPNPSENTDGLTLKMVQVLTRHGDRTPLYGLLSRNDVWDCNLGWLMVSSLNNVPGPINGVDRLFRKVYMPNREYFPGNCSDGQLTSLGFQQHLSLGQAFRQLYVDKYELLPSVLTNEDVTDTIWIRSTDVPRTIQSVQGHLTTLFPPTSVSGGSAIPVININTMDSYYENMTPNPTLCPELASLIANTTTTPEWAEFVSNTTQLKETVMKALDITVFPGWSSLMDLFFATQCHDFELPNGITQDIVTQVYDAAYWEYQYQLSFPMIARLGMSTFLEEIVDNIRSYINGTSSLKYIVFSGHDDSVGPFTNLFGLMSEWPPYASHVEIELWSNDSNQYFIQFKCNGISYTLNGCNNVMCPVESFFETSYSILVPDYSDACSNSTSF